MSTYRVVRVWVSAAFVAAAVALAWPGSPVVRAQAPYDSSLYSGLSWRMLGPFRGGRVDAVSGVPGRPNEFYFGAVNGGVWKTIDAGRVWTPDLRFATGRLHRRACSRPFGTRHDLRRQPASPPCAIRWATATACTSPPTPARRGRTSGSTTRSTSARSRSIPKNADHRLRRGDRPSLRGAPGPRRLPLAGRRQDLEESAVQERQRRRGRTSSIDPTNPRIVYASLWNTRRPTWYTYQPTNGPGGGLFKSTDGGTTWNQLTERPADRPASARPASRSRRATRGAFTRSWTTFFRRARQLTRRALARLLDVAQARQPRRGRRRPWTRRGAAAGAAARPPRSRAASTDRTTPARRGRSCPATPRCGVVAGISSTSSSIRKTRTSCTCRTWRCRDRRTAARRGCRCAAPPAATTTSSRGSLRMIPNTLICASDQGTVITRNATADDPRDVTWSSWLNQPIAQIYHLSVDGRFPYWVTGAQQDSGAVAVRSRGKFANITMRDWEPIGAGGESGMTAADPLHPGIIFGGARHALRPRNQSAAADDSASQPGAGPNGLDGSRWCSRGPIRTRCITRTSSSSRRRTARRRGRRSVRT